MSRKSTSWGRFTSFFRSSSKVEEGTRNIKITEKKQCIAHYKKISHNNDMVRANLLSNFALLVQRVGEMLLQCPCPCRPQDVHQRRGTMKKRKKKPSLAWPPVPRPRILCRNFLLPEKLKDSFPESMTDTCVSYLLRNAFTASTPLRSQCGLSSKTRKATTLKSSFFIGPNTIFVHPSQACR